MTATVSDPRADSVRLPLWRAILGFGVLGSLVVVLLALAPVYLQNYRLSGRVKTVVANTAATTPAGTASTDATEEALRQKLLQEARTFGLPVLPGDIKFTRSPQALEVQIRYIVHKNLGVYQVDLHFHPSAKAAFR